ncbi:response regulator transcription factor [uncultured Alsobacter sp.]|uniref:response regulator transcription factor n=1 Tax=uncultured Alsobacter sp. TaxID=1748258 RepID=UPI0025CF6EBE|nr:response regulator transcription factor [uncultured Alsobacter sp.]
MMSRILVVDDDPQIRDVVCFALGKAGMETCQAASGQSALDLLAGWRPQLVILDVGMPDMDGLETCRRIRRTSEVPILFLSARDDEIDRILGLEMGGDDYVTKPFSPRELVARIAAILRRGQRPAAQEPGHVLRQGGLVLDLDGHALSWDGSAVKVTILEFQLLQALIERPGQVLSRERLMQAAYGGGMQVSDRTIDSHVRNIRGKLAVVGCASAIETVHGLGFRLGPCRAPA